MRRVVRDPENDLIRKCRAQARQVNRDIGCVSIVAMILTGRIPLARVPASAVDQIGRGSVRDCHRLSLSSQKRTRLIPTTDGIDINSYWMGEGGTGRRDAISAVPMPRLTHPTAHRDCYSRELPSHAGESQSIAKF